MHANMLQKNFSYNGTNKWYKIMRSLFYDFESKLLYITRVAYTAVNLGKNKTGNGGFFQIPKVLVFGCLILKWVPYKTVPFPYIYGLFIYFCNNKNGYKF